MTRKTVELICLFRMLLMPIALLAAGVDHSHAATGMRTDVCPSSNEAQFQVRPLAQAAIETEKAKSSENLAKEVCNIFDAMAKDINDREKQSDPSATQARADLYASAPFFQGLIANISKDTLCQPIEDVLNALKKDVFFAEQLKLRGMKIVGAPQTTSVAVPAGAPGTGGVSWEVAVAKVLAKRAQEEFKAWFIDGIMSDICDGDARAYFPKFCNLYLPYVLGPTPSYDSLSKAFQKDLKELPPCLIWRNSQDEAGQGWGYIAMNLFRGIGDPSRKASPIHWLAGLADSSYVKDTCSMGNEDMCALYLGSTAAFAYLTSGRDANNNLKPAELIARTYIRMKDQNKYALIASITPKYVTDANAALNDYGLAIVYFSSVVSEIKHRMDELNSLDKDDPENQEHIAELTTEIAEKVVDAVEKAIQIVSKNSAEALQREVDQLARIRTIVHVVGALQSKRYDAVMADMTRVLYCISQDSIPAEYQAECKPWDEVRESVKKRASCAGMSESRESECEERAKKVKEALRFMTRYTPVAVELAGAKTTEELSQALDRAASPMGAWRMKRDRFMASLGGLVGWTYGRERLEAPDGSVLRGRYSALFAPVGLDVSWPIKSTDFTGGIFFSVIDVGNLMSVNTSQSDAIQVNDNPHATFQDVYSPGIYARIGMGRTPFVLGFGIAKTPGLRTAELADGSTASLNSVRMSAFIAMDITLFPLW